MINVIKFSSRNDSLKRHQRSQSHHTCRPASETLETSKISPDLSHNNDLHAVYLQNIKFDDMDFQDIQTDNIHLEDIQMDNTNLHDMQKDDNQLQNSTTQDPLNNVNNISKKNCLLLVSCVKKFTHAFKMFCSEYAW